MKKDIRQVIKSINDHWLNRQYNKIGDYIAEKVVLFQPGSDKRVYTREAYIQSYRDYDQIAITHEFSPGEPEIDIFGDTAVAVCPFYVEYELESKKYKEKGRDILIFSSTKGGWKLVWRTLQAEADK